VIVLCTDFGLEGPYIGQVKTVLARIAPAVPVVDLFADLPAFAPRLSAYLIAAYAEWFEAGDVILAVVDPGVGGTREALVVEADGRRFVGPRQRSVRARAATRAPGSLFRRHLATGGAVGDLPRPRSVRTGRGALGAGRAAAGTRGPAGPLSRVARRPRRDRLRRPLRQRHDRAARRRPRGRDRARDRRPARLPWPHLLGDVPTGQPLWYANANGLAEIGVNGGSAAARFGLHAGSPVRVHAPA
jgi:hypothetical protein